MGERCSSCGGVGTWFKDTTVSCGCGGRNTCWSCHGSGHKQQSDVVRCNTCYGSGHVESRNSYGGGSGTTSSGCFITTACCGHKGLSDDCYELKVLRDFRDRYMTNFELGRYQVNEYYANSPKIVENILHSKNKDNTLDKVYIQVQEAVALIEDYKFEEAHQKYGDIYLSLKYQFGQ